MVTKTPVPRKVARKKCAAKRARAKAPGGAPLERPIALLLHDDYAQQIRKIYSMSKEDAAKTVRKSGVLTPKGKLSAAYK